MCVFSRVLCVWYVFYIFSCMCVASRCFFLFFLRVGRKKWCFWGVPKKGVFSWFLRGLKGIFSVFFHILFFYFFFYIYFFYFLVFIFYFFIFYFLFFIFYCLSIYNFICYFIFYFLFLLLRDECGGYKYFLFFIVVWCSVIFFVYNKIYFLCFNFLSIVYSIYIYIGGECEVVCMSVE